MAYIAYRGPQTYMQRTPTGRPKSTHNRCVIGVFGGVLCCQFIIFFFLEFSFGGRAFVIGLSQISSFYLLLIVELTKQQYKTQHEFYSNIL